MKCLIIGLGTFGRRLAEELTNKGHDVAGVDSNEHRIEYIKDRISLSYIMDTTEKAALESLPLDEFDCIIVAIGQSLDCSLRTVAALKELGADKIYARAIDSVHKSILQAMNVYKIFIPESYAAYIFAAKLSGNEPFDME